LHKNNPHTTPPQNLPCLISYDTLLFSTLRSNVENNNLHYVVHAARIAMIGHVILNSMKLLRQSKFCGVLWGVIDRDSKEGKCAIKA
jgi:hypothetical protein